MHKKPVSAIRVKKEGIYFDMVRASKKVSPRETREGWPLLTIETEASGDSRSRYYI